jgi:hypothetical protein
MHTENLVEIPIMKYSIFYDVDKEIWEIFKKSTNFENI